MKQDGVFSYHILQDRERKNLAILELIRKKGPISRAEISRTLGLNIVTITNYTDYYIDKKIIIEMGLDVSSGGRRPELLELNAKSAYVVGVDIGPLHMTAVVADLKVRVINKIKVSRPSSKMEDLVPEVLKVIDSVIKKSGLPQGSIKNIGIGMSGIVDHVSNTIRDTDPARGRTKVGFLKFMKSIEEKFNVPVYIGNDASCAAFGEKTLNPGADVDNLVYLYSDVGCGMVVNGDVYIGASGCAGEVQLAFNGLQQSEADFPKEYMHMRPWGVDLGIALDARTAIEKGESTEILKLAGGDPKKVTKEIVMDAAAKNDKLAVKLIEEAGNRLGVRISYMVNFLNPSIIVIGGGMEKAGDIFLDAVKATARKLAFEEPSGVVKIVPSLLGEETVVLGAAALAAREVFVQA